MKNAAQTWFSGGSVYEEEVGQKSEDSSGLGFDIEAAVKTANDKVTGGFNLVNSLVSRGSFGFTISYIDF
ncbi:hypothetical protein MKW92_012173 [Papaver armeniacum]|nr:hypothetical protein MKW92_012173 [Papaver armeniacum]